MSDEEQRAMIEATLQECCADLFSDPTLMDKIYEESVSGRFLPPSDYQEEPYTEGGGE